MAREPLERGVRAERCAPYSVLAGPALPRRASKRLWVGRAAVGRGSHEADGRMDAPPVSPVHAVIRGAGETGLQQLLAELQLLLVLLSLLQELAAVSQELL